MEFKIAGLTLYFGKEHDVVLSGNLSDGRYTFRGVKCYEGIYTLYFSNQYGEFGFNLRDVVIADVVEG